MRDVQVDGVVVEVGEGLIRRSLDELGSADGGDRSQFLALVLGGSVEQTAERNPGSDGFPGFFAGLGAEGCADLRVGRLVGHA